MVELEKLVTRRKLLASAVLGVAAIGAGCASPVPGGGGAGTALSGKRLKVKLTFRAQINPNYYYFFLINNSNSATAPGPIPVGPPIANTTYGNGFATGSDSRSGGFTDFVLYSIAQYPGGQPSQNFGLYHVRDGADANDRSQFTASGVPVAIIPPTQTAGGNIIYFEVDLAQLFPTSTQSAAVSQALARRWMQVNVVATNVTPTDTQTSIYKEFDSFGDDSDARGNFLIIDLNQQAYINGDPTLAAGASEPSVNDVAVIPPGSLPQDPALDLTDWSIQITTS